MTTSLTTTRYKFLNGNLLFDSIANGQSTYYLFVGDFIEHANNQLQPLYDTTFDTYTYPYENMIFGKRISSSTMFPLIKHYEYTANTKYTMYTHDNNNLINEEFYVVTLEGSFYHTWKCLDNNNDGYSTVVPLFSDISGANTILYQTSDGYRWKYLYTVPNATADLFSTTEYFPVLPNTTTTAIASHGAIDIIKVEDQGRLYNNYIDGTFNIGDLRIGGDPTLYNISNTSAIATNGYYTGCTLYMTSGPAAGEYKTIVDYVSNSTGNILKLDTNINPPPGASDTFQVRPTIIVTSNDNRQTINCVARAMVNALNSNSIFRIDILERGANYHNATAVVVANGIVGISNTADVKPILSPPGGHGANVYAELYCANFGIVTTLSNTESSTIPATNDYQQFGIIKDPLFDNVVINLTSVNNTFLTGETIKAIQPVWVQPNVTISTTSPNITCNSAQFINQFGGTLPGNTIYLTSNDETQTQLATINSIANNISLQLTANALFSCTQVIIAFPNIYSSFECNSIVNSTQIIVNSMPGNLLTGSIIVGETTGTKAVVSNIVRQGVTKTFVTFVQLYKYNVNITSGSFAVNETVKLVSANTTAVVHSIVGGVLYLSNFSNGHFLVNDQFFGETSGAVGTVTSFYLPEVKDNSGHVLYIENIDPVTRQPNQKEQLVNILNF